MLRANEQGGGFAGGIYVDGGRDIVIEHNTRRRLPISASRSAPRTPASSTSGIIVRDNVVFGNDKAGIVFGGFKASRRPGEEQPVPQQHLLPERHLGGSGFGELWIQYAEDNDVRNNLFVSTAQNLLVCSEAGNVNNALDYNLFYTAAGAGSAQFVWQGT